MKANGLKPGLWNSVFIAFGTGLVVAGALGLFLLNPRSYPPAAGMRSIYASNSTRAVHVLDRMPTAIPGTRIGLAQDSQTPVVDYPDEKVLEISLGPVDLLAGHADIRFPVRVATFPFDGYLHGFDWSITQGPERGTAPDKLLHHMNIVVPETREGFFPMAQRLLAAGSETPQQLAPPIVGRPFHKGELMLITAKFNTPADKSWHDVTFHAYLYYSKPEGLLPVIPVQPFYLDVMNPIGRGFKKDFSVPPGRTVTSWERKSGTDGRILGVGGHLHDFGTLLRLEDVTAGEVLWETRPVTADAGLVKEVPTSLFLWKGGIPVYRDHLYRVTAEYDNPLDHHSHHGGMGAIGGIIVPTSDWPAVDARDSTYVSELTSFLNYGTASEGD